jgi:hypothetical protein
LCSKVGARRIPHDGKRLGIASPADHDHDSMAKVIRCQCGFLARGETPEDTADLIEAHVRADHPELTGRVRREDFLAMAEEA